MPQIRSAGRLLLYPQAENGAAIGTPSRGRAGCRCRRGGGRGRAGTCARGSLSGCGGGLGGRRAALLGRVVVHIPSGAFELQARRGQRALDCAAAFRTFPLRLGAEVLDLFKAVTTLGTPIRIEGQGSLPLRQKITTPSIVAAIRQMPVICALRGPISARTDATQPRIAEALGRPSLWRSGPGISSVPRPSDPGRWGHCAAGTARPPPTFCQTRRAGSA